MKKPVRRVRRFFKRQMKGKGRGRGGRRRLTGRGIRAYVAALSDDAYEELFFGGRGRSKGKGKGRPRLSSGKGKGRRTNPRGKNGSVMECFECGSRTRLRRDCPGKGGR